MLPPECLQQANTQAWALKAVNGNFLGYIQPTTEEETKATRNAIYNHPSINLLSLIIWQNKQSQMTIVSNPPKSYFAADLVAVIAMQTSRILETLLALKLLPSRPE
jgi:hypothetical protein